jgi:hypothetical protein
MYEIAAGGNSPALHMASKSPRIFNRALRIEIGAGVEEWAEGRIDGGTDCAGMHGRRHVKRSQLLYVFLILPD